MVEEVNGEGEVETPGTYAARTAPCAVVCVEEIKYMHAHTKARKMCVCC